MDFSVHSWAFIATLLVIVTVAAVLDFKSHRIPNWLSFSGWLLGPLLHLAFAGIPALTDSMLGLLLVLMLTFPLFVVRWMGAGDVKLMTSVGALVGVDHALLFLASIVITGFVLGVAQLLWRGILPALARRYWAMLGLSLGAGRPVYLAPDYAQSSVTMPYAVSIAIGTLAALCIL